MIGLKTRFGEIHFEVSERGLARLELPATFHRGKDSSPTTPCPASKPKTAMEKRVARELTGYFAGKLKRFTFPIDISGVSEFGQKVLQACFAIPYGAFVSYGDLARMAGRPRAARAVGRLMATNPIAVVIPCHRVVGSTGGLCGYGGGLDMKKALLEHEGAGEARTKDKGRRPRARGNVKCQNPNAKSMSKSK